MNSFMQWHLALNSLSWSPLLDPLKIRSHPTTFGRANRDTAASDSLREAGIIFVSRNSPVRHFVQAEVKLLGGANNSVLISLLSDTH